MNKQECLKNKKEMIGCIKNTIDTHSRLALELDANQVIDSQEYDWEDLFNALNIFMHITSNISTSHYIRKWFTLDQMKKLSAELWENIRQTVLLGTWIDTHKLAERLINKK